MNLTSSHLVEIWPQLNVGAFANWASLVSFPRAYVLQNVSESKDFCLVEQDIHQVKSVLDVWKCNG